VFDSRNASPSRIGSVAWTRRISRRYALRPIRKVDEAYELRSTSLTTRLLPVRTRLVVEPQYVSSVPFFLNIGRKSSFERRIVDRLVFAYSLSSDELGRLREVVDDVIDIRASAASASATRPTRLVTRTKVSNICASQWVLKTYGRNKSKSRFGRLRYDPLIFLKSLAQYRPVSIVYR